jgi:predicted nucleic acid-binding Zn ribbon protein
MENKTCIHCGKEIEGRLDKKFCDHYCRNSFNNKITRESEKRITEINRILRKNRTILSQINPQGKTTIRKDYIALLGFNFNYFTHQYVTQNKGIYKFCYEYGYIIAADDPEKIIIVNWQDYMNNTLL